MDLIKFIVAFTFLFGTSFAEFPNSDNPYEAGLPLSRDMNNCSVTLFDNVSLTNYGQVETSIFDGPCVDDWSSVILEFHGAVQGVQYDRAGCVWLDGVELLRTTTPEPTTAGINWNIVRELNQYSALFKRSSGKNATLQIPNTVDSTYTGVLYITVKLTFVSSSSSSSQKKVSKSMEKKAESVSWDKNIGLSPPTSEIWDNVIALSPPTSSSNPWGDMSIQGNGSKVAQIKFDRHDIISAKLDLYASGHGCEEFWYSNVPDDVGEQYGICGGGTYREIRLTVDGFLAGILYPFPVVYTGGINPLLWRPMTGIQSFNIPPYSFDLTPFVGSWNSNNRVDDETHTFEITVYGNNDQGSWFVDPVLLLNYYDLETVPSPLCHGDILDFYNSPPDVDVTKVSALTYETTGIDYYMVYGIVYTPDSSKMLNYQVTGNFTSSNYNDYGNGVTYGQMDQQVESAYFIYHYSDDDDDADWVWTSNMQIYSYPYSITLDDTSNDDYLYIHASVNYSCHKQGLFNWVTFQGYSDSINTTAVYNRSNDILRTMNEETNHALQRFHMIPSTDSTSPSTSCFDLLINAVNGSTSNKDSSDNNCENVIDLCSTYDACVLSPISPQQHGHKHEKKKHSTEELLFRVPSSYTFRNLKEQYN